MSTSHGPLEQMLGMLPPRRRYVFEVDHRGRAVSFHRGGMHAVARQVKGGMIRIVYEWAMHEPVQELCTPEQAAALIDAVMMRERLCRVPRPTSQ
jgi:hypothetical protein